MAFGQQSGPPATGRQVRELVDLVVAAGHADLRDARHALGLTQRQAGGKFTRDEAQTLIDQLLEAEHQGSDDGLGEGDGGAAPAEATVPAPVRQKAAAADRKAVEQARSLRRVPDEVLAAELQRRGWVVVQP
jgi:hypothetical protein